MSRYGELKFGTTQEVIALEHMAALRMEDHALNEARHGRKVARSMKLGE